MGCGECGRTAGTKKRRKKGRKQGSKEARKQARKIHHRDTEGTEEHREGRKVTLRLRAFSVFSVSPW